MSFDLDSHDWEFKVHHRRPVPLVLDGHGHVVLMHDGGGDRSMTLRYAQNTIVQALRAGYSFTTPVQLADDPSQALTYGPAGLTDQASYWAVRAVVELVRWASTLVLVLGLFGVLVLNPLYLCMAGLEKRRRDRAPPAPLGAAPVVSVALSAYNEELVIAASVASILASDYPHLEVIAVDDGSTDRTGALLDQLAAADPRLRVLHVANAGKPDALNRAFRCAQADIIVTLDADTVCRPDTISKLVRHFRDPRVAAVAGFVRVGNVNNLLTAWQGLEYIMGIGVERGAQSVLRTITVVPGACAAWRRELVLHSGGYSRRTLTEDCDLALTFQRRRYRILQDNSAIAYTEAPSTVRPLLRQRFRWTFGNLQSYWKHRAMLFRPRYGLLGTIMMPYTFLTLFKPLVLFPIRLAAIAAILLWSSHIQAWLLLGGSLVLLQLALTAIGLRMLQASLWYLLLVPIYWLIDEPLRVIVVTRAVLAALRGHPQHWNKLQRLGMAAPSR